jgi:hypothetical protein
MNYATFPEFDILQLFQDESLFPYGIIGSVKSQDMVIIKLPLAASENIM